MILFATASDVAAWVAVAIGVVSLGIAWAGFRRATNAKAAAREVRQRFRLREILDAFDAMDARRVELDREHQAGDGHAAESALRDWRTAAQRLSDQLDYSGSQARRDARSALEKAVGRTSRMAGVGGAVSLGPKTMGDAVAEVDHCDLECGRFRDEVRHELI